MARYIDPVCKICRRGNEKLFLKGTRCFTPKCAVDKRKPAYGRRRRRVSDRGLQLMQKQKLRYSYGMLEKQFRRNFVQAEKQAGITGDNLLSILEKRLDNVVFRLGFAESRAQARQLVQHGHFQVNGRRMDIPSYSVKEGDTISWKETSTKTEYVKQLREDIGGRAIVGWLSLDKEKLVGRAISTPTPGDISADFDGQAIVEYYSR